MTFIPSFCANDSLVLLKLQSFRTSLIKFLFKSEEKSAVSTFIFFYAGRIWKSNSNSHITLGGVESCPSLNNPSLFSSAVKRRSQMHQVEGLNGYICTFYLI